MQLTHLLTFVKTSVSSQGKFLFVVLVYEVSTSSLRYEERVIVMRQTCIALITTIRADRHQPRAALKEPQTCLEGIGEGMRRLVCPEIVKCEACHVLHWLAPLTF